MIIASENIGPEKWHGTTGGTSNHRCKCLACRTVWAAYVKQRRVDRAAQVHPDDPRHGSSSFYLNHSCRCVRCTAAHTEARRQSTAKKKVAK